MVADAKPEKALAVADIGELLDVESRPSAKRVNLKLVDGGLEPPLQSL